MEPLVDLIIIGIALEAFIQFAKNLWDSDERGKWTYTRFAVVIIPVVAAFNIGANNIPAGLDFGQPFLSQLISGLIVARIAQWVHDIYKKTE